MRGGFSLVEVAIATTVMASAALLLGAVLGASGGQKTAARRQALAKSLAVRQLELVQERINESQLDRTRINMNLGLNPGYKLLPLRNAARTYSFTRDGNPHFYCYSGEINTLSTGRGRLVDISSPLHVLFPSTDATTPTPPGSMLPAESARIGAFGENLNVQLYVAAVNADGHTDNNQLGAQQLPPQLTGVAPFNEGNIQLLMFQVVILDTLNDANGVPVLTLSRMYRVQSELIFQLEGQF